ncbi:MAG: PspA/IM30 family protein [Gammaproteobacteria bacterium]|nr:PspA/IM30 family protein [Gammaproteobacteria bacterium]
MALINRVSRLFKADFHAVLDQIEEPELLLKQAIREMEDELAAAEQRINRCAQQQDALATRRRELENTLAGIDGQLDLCFEAGKDELAKNLIRRKLEAGRLLQRLDAKHSANDRYLADQGAMLEENRATLEGLRQKAELVAQRAPAHSPDHFMDRPEFNDTHWMAREMTVGDDEVEVAFLREKSLRSAS